MTASPIACKSGSIVSKITELETNINCKLLCSQEILADFKKLVPIPNYSLFRYSSGIPDAVEKTSMSSDFFANAQTVRQKTASLFPKQPLDLFQTAGKSYLLLYALLRVRHANYINDIYKLLRTVQMQPSDFDEFRRLDLPTHDALFALRKAAAAFGTGKPKKTPKNGTAVVNEEALLKYTRLRTRHLLRPVHSVYSGLAELVLDVGKLIRIAEDCGILCAVHAYAIILSGKGVKVAPPTAGAGVAVETTTQTTTRVESAGSVITTTNEDANTTVMEVTTTTTTRCTTSGGQPVGSKRAQLFQQAASERVSSVDMDKAGCVAEELLNGPFRCIDLVDLEYAACVSMLDVFVCLVTSLGCEVCLSARDIILAAVPADETLPPCQSLVCMLLDRIATAKGLGRPFTLRLQIEGVLSLVPEFCEQFHPTRNQSKKMTDKTQASTFQLCDAPLRLALGVACRAILQAVPPSELRRLFQVDMPSKEYAFEPLKPDVHSHAMSFSEEPLGYTSVISRQQDEKRMKWQQLTAAMQSGGKINIAGGHLYADYALVTDKLVALYHVWSMIGTIQLQEAPSDTFRDEEERGGEVLQLQPAPSVSGKESDVLAVVATENGVLTFPDSATPKASSPASTKEWAGIVFCRMRLSALSISNLMSSLCGEADKTPEAPAAATSAPLDFTPELMDSLTNNSRVKSSYRPSESALDFTPTDCTFAALAETAVPTVGAEVTVDGSPCVPGSGIGPTDFRALQIIGNTKQRVQLEALMKFRSGEYNVLFATDVVEEGLDVRACQFVINFDLPMTVKSYIQRRGRARAANSTIIAMVPYGECGLRLVEDLVSFDQQEAEMERYAEGNVGGLVEQAANAPTESDVDLVEGDEKEEEEEEQLVSLSMVLEAVVKTRCDEAETMDVDMPATDLVSVSDNTFQSAPQQLVVAPVASATERGYQMWAHGANQFSAAAQAAAVMGIQYHGGAQWNPQMPPYSMQAYGAPPFTPSHMFRPPPPSTPPPVLFGQFVPSPAWQYNLGQTVILPGRPTGLVPFRPPLPPPRPMSSALIVPPKVLDRYVVPSTGVIADVRSSTQLLARFCQMLPHDSFYVPRPVYWVTTLRNNALYGSYGASRNPTYRCAILLPPSVPMRCRFVVGPECESKAQAKGAASLDAIRQLHLEGELSDLLLTNGSKQADKAERTAQQQQLATVEQVEADALAELKRLDPANDLVSGVGKKRSLAESESAAALADSADFLTLEDVTVPAKCDSDLVTTVVKTVPDALIFSPVRAPLPVTERVSPQAVDDSVGLYLYAVRAEFVDELSREIIHNCISCSNNFFAINEVGIAFTSELPDDVFQSVFDCNFRETEGLTVKIELLEYRSVSSAELLQMQRFHKSVLCWESDSKRYHRPECRPRFDEPTTAGLPDEVWIPPDADLREYYDGTPEGLQRSREHFENPPVEKPASHDEWRQSSNGAWYVIFPLPDDIFEKKNSTDVAPSTSLQDVSLNRARDATFNALDKWCAFLKQSADEAQVLAHNLRMQETLNKQEYTDFYQPFLPVQPVSDLSGLLVSRGPGGIFWVMEDEPAAEKKRLGDIVKYVKVEPPVVAAGESEGDNATENGVQSATVNPSGVMCTNCDSHAKKAADVSDIATNVMSAEPLEVAENPPVTPVEEEELIAVSYADHFLVKYPRYEPVIRVMERDPAARPLLKVVPITSRLTLTYLLGKAYVKMDDQATRAIALPFYSSLIPIQPKKPVPERIRKNHSHSNAIYLIPDFCRPIGRVKWLTVGFVAPSIIWRIQSLLHSVEARNVVVQAVVDFERNCATVNLAGQDEDVVRAVTVAGVDGAMEVVAPDEEISQALTLRKDGQLTILTVPSALMMLETLTPRLTKENLDSERLELLGDSLLKLVTSVEIFRIYPSKHEGFLTSQRSKVISNLHLTDMSQKLGLDRYLRAFPLSSGKQQLLVRPPGMSFHAVKRGLSLWNENLVVKRSILAAAAATAAADGEMMTDSIPPVDSVVEEVPKTDRQVAAEFPDAASYYEELYPVPQFETVEVKSKALADVMEAIFGGFYVEGGLKSGVTAIKALGCWPVFDAESNFKSSVRERTRHQKQQQQQLKWSVSMEIHHEAEEHVDFPEHFPEPLKRITQGITIDLGGMAEGDSDDEEEGEEVDAHVKTVERTTTTTVTVTKASVKAGDVDGERVQTTIAPSVRSSHVTQAIVDSVAAAMGYTFKNWAILDEALTHCSVQYKRSNQRMEFLGDAILDFAVVSLLFKHQPWARQGDLSSQKSIATSNKNLGQFGARLQLYRYLNLSSQQLEMEFAKLDRLMASEHAVSETEEQQERPAKKARTSEASEATGQASVSEVSADEYVPPPGPKVIEMGSGASKALADTFEALVGAIYLDCRGEMEDLYIMVRYINLLPQLEVE
eukprot:gene22615-28752_t